MIDEIDVINKDENLKIVKERFELIDYGYKNTPVVFANRYVKNSDGKIYSYATFVDRDIFLKYKFINNALYKDSNEEKNKEYDNLALLQAFHEKYNRVLTTKEIFTLINSEHEIDLNDDENWVTLGYYNENSIPKSLKRR